MDSDDIWTSAQRAWDGRRRRADGTWEEFWALAEWMQEHVALQDRLRREQEALLWADAVVEATGWVDE